MKAFKKLETITRGFSNHRRIEILNLLSQSPNLSVSEISEALEVNFKTIAVHTHRLFAAGLLGKRNLGQAVRHSVTPLGNNVLKFLRTLE